MRSWLLAGILLVGTGFAHADTHVYDGRAQPDCTFSHPVYTCSTLALADKKDSIEIASGIQVNLSEAAVFDHHQGLKMSGSARLTSARDIDISNIKPSLLDVTGGSFESARTIYMGSQKHDITANFKAGELVLGSGSHGSITGTLEASGRITIGSHMTVIGNIAGAVVTANPHVTIQGSVSASTSFSLGSHGAMTGNLDSPDVKLLASHVTLTGNVTSTGSVHLASGNRITGNVTADTLTLDASHSYVGGTATVRLATLGWAARVAQKIYCTGGTTAGACDCVVNNSGYAVNSTDGPSCAAAATAVVGADHIRVSHPTAASTCMPQTATLTACANASCSSLYTGGVTVALNPGGTDVTIGSSGVNDSATLSQSTAGTALISLSGSAAPPLSCTGTGGGANTADCKIAFLDAALLVTTPDHVAESADGMLTLKAVKTRDSGTSCAPAFTGPKTVTLQCAYLDPASGNAPVRIGGFALNAASNNAAVCDAAGKALSLTFDATGTARAALSYADVGKVSITASIASPSMSGSGSFVAGPYSFGFSNFSFNATSPSLIKAGVDFTGTVTAKTSTGNIARNFGKERSAETVTFTHLKCAPGASNVNPGTLTASTGAFSSGAATATLSWSEVGVIDLTATLGNSSYLGSGLARATGNTGTGGTPCASANGNVGRFIPDHFTVAVSQPLTFTYSGQPLAISAITARNAKNGITNNYSGDYARKLTITAYGSTGTVNGSVKPALGDPAGTAVGVAPTSFISGVYSGSVVYTFDKPLTAPALIKLHAVDTDNVGSKPETEGDALIRSGRLRVFSAFGRAGANLSVPVRAEFWSGNSWILNGLHDGTIEGTAVALLLGKQTSGTRVVGNITLDKGQGNIVLQAPAYSLTTGVGVVDLAVNLGSGPKDESCVKDLPDSTGAVMPWLRSRNGNCATTYDRDPATRATFGGSTPESRRVIHVREVFR